MLFFLFYLLPALLELGQRIQILIVGHAVTPQISSPCLRPSNLKGCRST